MILAQAGDASLTPDLPRARGRTSSIGWGKMRSISKVSKTDSSSGPFHSMQSPLGATVHLSATSLNSEVNGDKGGNSD
jgi:hypothetical protein